MLAQMTPAQLVEWQVAREVLPLDDGWRQTDTVARAIHDELAVIRAMKAGRTTVPRGELSEEGDYIPQVIFDEPQAVRVNQSAIDAYAAALESQYGQHR